MRQKPEAGRNLKRLKEEITGEAGKGRWRDPQDGWKVCLPETGEGETVGDTGFRGAASPGAHDE